VQERKKDVFYLNNSHIQSTNKLLLSNRTWLNRRHYVCWSRSECEYQTLCLYWW